MLCRLTHQLFLHKIVSCLAHTVTISIHKVISILITLLFLRWIVPYFPTRKGDCVVHIFIYHLHCHLHIFPKSVLHTHFSKSTTTCHLFPKITYLFPLICSEKPAIIMQRFKRYNLQCSKLLVLPHPATIFQSILRLPRSFLSPFSSFPTSYCNLKTVT